MSACKDLAVSEMVNALSVDVEEYFQVEAFAQTINPHDWDKFPPRVERNVGIILDLLEKRSIKATFFCVGWVARKYPGVIKEIARRGHEIGSHGMTHRPLFRLTPEEFRQEVRESKRLLEDLSGQRILGFRAPTYSVTKKTLWGLEILAEEGYMYDSSIFPVKHDFYGFPEAPRFPFRVKELGLIEFPISTYKVGGLNLPVAGGGYFRLFPYGLTRFFLKRINRVERKPFVFYCHPWEFDPEQPRLPGPFKSKFRHYLNLDRTKGRFRNLLHDFRFDTLENVLERLNRSGQIESQSLVH